MNPSPTQDRATVAYRAAGWAVTAILLGFEVEWLAIEQRDAVHWEGRLEFHHHSRPLRTEEKELMSVCGVWAEATLRYGKTHSEVRAALLREVPWSDFDPKSILERFDLVCPNYAEPMDTIASGLLAGKIFAAHELRNLVYKKSVGDSKPN